MAFDFFTRYMSVLKHHSELPDEDATAEEHKNWREKNKKIGKNWTRWVKEFKETNSNLKKLHREVSDLAIKKQSVANATKDDADIELVDALNNFCVFIGVHKLKIKGEVGIDRVQIN